MGSTRAWAVWAAGLTAYTVAVLQRTTLGVAGLAAATRFDSSAGIVATFVVLQLVVYAGMQVPAGALLDRFGPRAMVTTGAALMCLGQGALSVSDSVATALLARALVGCGDAMTFGSVIRLVPAWFPSSRVPLLTQLTGLVGQAGQLLSALPFATVLMSRGWTAAFLGAAAVGLASAVLAGATVRDAPADAPPPSSPRRAAWGAGVRDAWRHPGTRLGMWTHGATAFPPLVFALMWGFPFLLRGEGLDPTSVGALFILFVLAGVGIGPALGVLTHRFPRQRSAMAMGVVCAMASAWLAVLLWPGPAPIGLLTVLVLAVSAGGPASAIALDLARTFNPAGRLGAANGLVIAGGFTAALLNVLLIGLVLDLVSHGRPYTLDDFRLAMAVQLPFLLLGLAMIARTRAQLRAATATGAVAASGP